jgi:hypothetical protein
MDIAEFGLGFVRCPFEGCRVGNVNLHRAGADVERRELAAGDLELRFFDVGEDDVDPVARQGPANAEADAIGGTGDEGGLAGEVHHDRPDRTAFLRD